MSGAAIDYADELGPVVERLYEAGINPSRLTSAFAAYMLMSTQRRFETQTDPEGKPWKPLSSRTIRARTRRRRNNNAALTILRVSGRLFQSLVAQSDQSKAETGTNLIYAGPHQFGGEIQIYARGQKSYLKRVGSRYRFAKAGAKGAEQRNIEIGEHVLRIPARPYLGFSDEDQKELVAIGQDILASEAGL